jgi:hypothetical protein
LGIHRTTLHRKLEAMRHEVLAKGAATE